MYNKGVCNKGVCNKGVCNKGVLNKLLECFGLKKNKKNITIYYDAQNGLDELPDATRVNYISQVIVFNVETLSNVDEVIETLKDCKTGVGIIFSVSNLRILKEYPIYNLLNNYLITGIDLDESMLNNTKKVEGVTNAISHIRRNTMCCEPITISVTLHACDLQKYIQVIEMLDRVNVKFLNLKGHLVESYNGNPSVLDILSVCNYYEVPLNKIHIVTATSFRHTLNYVQPDDVVACLKNTTCGGLGLYQFHESDPPVENWAKRLS
jgi:hypothetical protein